MNTGLPSLLVPFGIRVFVMRQINYTEIQLFLSADTNEKKRTKSADGHSLSFQLGYEEGFVSAAPNEESLSSPESSDLVLKQPKTQDDWSNSKLMNDESASCGKDKVPINLDTHPKESSRSFQQLQLINQTRSR